MDNPCKCTACKGESQKTQRIVIYYPEDGAELHIDVEKQKRRVFPIGIPNFQYSFTHAALSGNDAWQVLVKVAKAIIAQDDRMNGVVSKKDHR